VDSAAIRRWLAHYHARHLELDGIGKPLTHDQQSIRQLTPRIDNSKAMSTS